MKEYLKSSHPNTIKNCFGTTDNPGELHDCENTIDSVFSKLTDKQKNVKHIYSKIRVDEIHIKPATRYQGNHDVSCSQNELIETC